MRRRRRENSVIATVTAWVPANAATGVPIGNKLTVTFSEAMKSATINTTTYTLKRGQRLFQAL